jgi:hypothetical protein
MANEPPDEENRTAGGIYGLMVHYVNSRRSIGPSMLHPILPPNIRWVTECVSQRAADRRMERILMATGHDGVVADFIRSQESHN